MRIVEILIALFLVTAFGYDATASREAAFPVLIGALILATAFYAYLGFLIFNGIRLRKAFKASSYQGLTIVQIVASVMAGFNIGLSFCGMMFYLFQWPGSEMYRKACPVMTGLMMAVAMYAYFAKGSKIGKRVLIRSIPLLLLCLYVFFVHKS